MTTFKQRLRNELKESINYVLTELSKGDPSGGVAPPTQSFNLDAWQPIEIGPDWTHVFAPRGVDQIAIINANPNITFTEVVKRSGGDVWTSGGETEVKTEVTVGLPFLRLVGRLGAQFSDKPAWFQETFTIWAGVDGNTIAFNKTNQAINDAPASGTQEDFKEELDWGSP